MKDKRFLRIERMIGTDGLNRLSKCHVAVIGLGAVGSYAVEGLTRAGVGRLRLVDFDVVRPSNINRQLYALESTVGQRKCDVAQCRVKDINPHCQVETMCTFVHTDTIPTILAGPPDLIIDAIDSLGPKVELLATAMRLGIPLLSVMGAALRTDPTCVRVGPLSEVHHCPLAAKVRKKLRRHDIETNFPCVYSIESIENLPDDVIGPGDTGEPEFLSRGRDRQILGSLPTLTGIFGLTAANVALQLLLRDYFPGRSRMIF